MGLKPIRQTEQVNVDFITPWTQERGGCLSLTFASGIDFVEYAFDPSGLVPFGIQLNDIEWMNLTRHFNRTYSPGVLTDVPCGTVGVALQGDFVTDWVHVVGEIFPGDPAFSGPSGTFTNSASFGGLRIGKFIGSLRSDPHQLTMRGLGFSRQFIDPCTKKLTFENNPADAVHVLSPGYIKIRVDFGK